MALTAITINNLKPREADYRVADSDSLYLLVRPNGSKLWRYDYRLGGVRRTLSIGEYGNGKGEFTLQQARGVRDQAKQAVARGEHPASQKQRAAAEADKAAEAIDRLFGTLADNWLVGRKENNSPKTYARDARSVTYLQIGYRGAKGFGELDAAEVQPHHLSDLTEKFNKPTRVRVISAARKIMGIAKRKGFIHHSPFADVDFEEGLAKHKVTHRPAITNEAAFGELLRRMQSYEGRGNNLTWYALNLLALTFVRPDLVAKAEWRQFDLDAARWIIPFETLKMEWLRSETGAPRDDFFVPLSRQAVALLRELHEITGDRRYLFPGCGEAEAMSENTINYALHALGYKGFHCAHGFRSSASTFLNRQRVKGRRRFERSLIELQLDHQDASVRAIYDRDDCLPERVNLMQFWADLMDEYRSGKLRKGKVPLAA